MFNKPGHSNVASFSFLATLAGFLLSTGAWTQESAESTVLSDEKLYKVDYTANFQPAEGIVRMTITVRQPRRLLRSMQISADPQRYRSFSSNQPIEETDGTVTWLPTSSGGTLTYQVVLNQERNGDGFDSLMSADWAVFRGDDLVPPVKTRAVKGAKSKSRLRMTGPPEWSYISVYKQASKKSDWLAVDWLNRKFDRPIGWMAAGHLGVRWEDVDETRIALAGPIGEGIRRMDMAAFLRWNLPTLRQVFPMFPHRLLIVSAGDPMWRGGLSGPNSLFIHADRPLISANGTSTLLHELVHVAQPYQAEQGEDWIIESMAEFYSLEIMRRSGTISERRYEMGLEQLESWSSEADKLQADESSGSRTAKGVAVMHALDSELREVSGGKISLDDVVKQLCEKQTRISLEKLRQTAEALAGEPLGSLPSKGTAY
jgi:hypothetical protein